MSTPGSAPFSARTQALPSRGGLSTADTTPGGGRGLAAKGGCHGGGLSVVPAPIFIQDFGAEEEPWNFPANPSRSIFSKDFGMEAPAASVDV